MLRKTKKSTRNCPISAFLIDFFAINQSKMLVSDIKDESNDTTGKEFVSSFSSYMQFC